MRKVEFFKHNLGEREFQDVGRVMRGLFLTTGEEVRRFESQLAAYLGLAGAVGVTSCTAALQLSLTALGVGPGDEVITTPISFAATALAAIQAGATPVFADVEPGTGNLDAAKIEAAITARTKAILPVHLFGQLCEMRAIRRIADQHGLVVVEDAAHALEAGRDGVRVGELSHAACFSFYPTKSITCGEGGAIAVHDPALADRLRSLRHHGMTQTAVDRYGKDDVSYDITEMGWKYNMDNIQAALLIGQLERVERFLARRREIAARYRRQLCTVPGLRLMENLAGAGHSQHLFPILVPAEARSEFVRQMVERGIGVSVNYKPIHLLTFFRRRFGLGEGMFPEAERLGACEVSLPIYPRLKDSEVELVVRTAAALAKELKLAERWPEHDQP